MKRNSEVLTYFYLSERLNKRSMMMSEAIIRYGYNLMPSAFRAMTPINPFIAVCPTRAMASATLKAVPDREG